MSVVSISFPDMIKHHSVQVVSGREATEQNLKCLINSEKDTFTCDPFYGVHLQRYTFDQNDRVLQTLLQNEIYKQVKYFMPQLTINRSDIVLKKGRAKLDITIKAINKLSFTPDTYNLVLFEED